MILAVKLPKTGDGDLGRRPRQKYPIPGTKIEKTTQNWGNCCHEIPKTGEFLLSHNNKDITNAKKPLLIGPVIHTLHTAKCEYKSMKLISMSMLFISIIQNMEGMENTFIARFFSFHGFLKLRVFANFILFEGFLIGKKT